MSMIGDCVPTSNTNIYEENFDFIDFGSFGIESFMIQQLLLWSFIFLPMIFVSIVLSCILGKLSDKLFCVPMVNKESAKFDDIKLEDAKGFKGFGSKFKALIKAVTISGKMLIVHCLQMYIISNIYIQALW